MSDGDDITINDHEISATVQHRCYCWSRPIGSTESMRCVQCGEVKYNNFCTKDERELIDTAAGTIAAKDEQIAMLREALADVQYGAGQIKSNGPMWECPACQVVEPKPHRDYCNIGRALAATAPPEPSDPEAGR